MKKNRTTHAMAGVFMVIFVMAFLIVTGRFLYIQASGEVEGVSLNDWAENVRTASYTLDSERGNIFDKNGMTLAYDMPTFRMYAIVDEKFSENLEEPQHVDDPVGTADKLAPLLDADRDYILERINNGIDNGRTQVEFGNVGKGISLHVKDDIEALNLPGIRFIKENIRYYPNGMFASHIIGFAQEKALEEGETKTEIIGITGIEREMNELLKGQDGFISYQRDIYNKKLLNPNEVVRLPDNGDDVYLTIDQKIQTLLEDVMSQVDEKYAPERMTAIVMNPKTGEIVAMSNRPSYNPNNPANVENWYNDAISTPFEPGSTIKMFTWAAAIESGVYKGDEGYQSGSYQVTERDRAINDFNGGKGWGVISYDEGFARSSNVAAAKLVWEKMGPDTFLENLYAFDFDKPTGIDLPGEVQGSILYNWPIEKITTSFGQGSTTTPIQIMKAATAIANDGKMLKPYVIDKIVDSDTGKVLEDHKPEVVGEPISKETAEQVRKLLVGAVQSEHAVGRRFNLDDYSVGGKTGTAQIPNPEGGGYLYGHENYVFSFIGMAPIDDPELMMYVSVKQPTLEFETGIEPGSAPVSFIFNNVMENALHYLNIDPDKGEISSVQVSEIPNLTGKSVSSAVDILNSKKINYSLVGNGDKVVQISVEEGAKVLANERVIVVTNTPTMPNIIGWSLRDVLKLTDMLELDLETFGNGFVVTQSIEEERDLTKGAYLGVELKTPKELQELKSEENAETGEEPVDTFE
ncbi:penicillin-binding protein [Ornithinibacillus californiensis]|uniref:penicillin-binding protein n=1 Tax=Ornithinibacillus californiensis TaxID=161536 RepID=UPI00064DA50C|nr:penicillin-binding protein [Ornithinibacillus californiensis]